MKLKEKWKGMALWQKICIALRDLGLYTVLFSALPHVLTEFDNSVLVLVCLPLSAGAQAALSWKNDRKTALFFLFGGIFIFVIWLISTSG